MAISLVRIAMGWTAEVRFPAGETDFSLLHSVQTGSGASCLMGTGGSFGGCKAEHSPPSNTEVKNDGAIPPRPYTSSWVGTCRVVAIVSDKHSVSNLIF
jgi:hypothetical protein